MDRPVRALDSPAGIRSIGIPNAGYPFYRLKFRMLPDDITGRDKTRHGLCSQTEFTRSAFSFGQWLARRTVQGPAG